MSDIDFGYVLLVFAKAPQAGHVKTRLAPLLSDNECANLHAMLTRHTLQTFCTDSACNVELWCSPSTRHGFFVECENNYSVKLCTQTGELLGLRMYNALHDALTRYERAIIIGTDCPSLNFEYLYSAMQKLKQGCDIVIGAAQDGGYVLLAANRIDRLLFTDIQWGTESVLSETLARLETLCWSYSILPELRDIDTPRDFHASLENPLTAKLLEPFAARLQVTE